MNSDLVHFVCILQMLGDLPCAAIKASPCVAALDKCW